MKKNKKVIDYFEPEFLRTAMVSIIIADFDNSTNYSKNVQHKRSYEQINNLRKSGKYFIVSVSYDQMDEIFLKWLYNCDKFVYIIDLNSMYFGFKRINDALMCKLRFSGVMEGNV